MHKLIVAIVRSEKIENVTSALKSEGIPFTYSSVKGYCGEVHLYQKDIHDRIKIEVLSLEADVQRIKDIVMANACCGLEGDGCISVYALDDHITFSPEHAEDLK